MKQLAAIILAVLLTGCGSMIPKKVEFFQDTVAKYPEPSPALREQMRQAVYRAHDKAAVTVRAAVAENASTNVIAPAKEVERLTESVSFSLGPPEDPPMRGVTSEAIAFKLERSVAKLNEKIEDFKTDNNVNTGKKIEGTGLVQISYVWYVGGILAAICLLFIAGKIALTLFAAANPAAAVGLGVVNVAQAVVTKGFSQLIKGGENFKNWVEKEVSDPAVKQKVLEAFRATHKQAQDFDVQSTVRAVTS
jgi:hypothetical protein